MQVEGKSIDAQLAEMREYVKSRGWKIVEEYVDAGVSGTKMDRPEFQRMMADMEERRFDIVLVHELSRLSRSVYDAFDIFAQLGRHEVGFASVKEQQFDYTKPHDRLILHLLTLLHQYYVDILREHVSKSKRQRARTGLHNASIPPYGYKRASSPDTPFEIDEKEAEAVRLIFEMYATRRYSMQEIADDLNNKNFHRRIHHPSKSKRDDSKQKASFTADAVRDILRNRFYIGDVTYGYRSEKPEIYQGKHAPIISQELWDKAQEALRIRRSKSRAYHKPFRVYLLSGLAHCALCKAPLRSQATPSGRRYYREAAQKFSVACPHHNIGAEADQVEKQLGVLFSQIRLPDDWLDEINNLANEEAVLEIELEREKLNKKLERLKDLYLHGFYDHLEEGSTIYWNEIQRLQDQLKALPETDPEMVIAASNSFIAMSEIWEEATMTEKRELVRQCLRKVFIDVSEPRIVALCPHSEFIPLFQRLPFLQDTGGGCFSFLPTSEEDARLLDIEVWPPLDTTLGDWLQFPYIKQWEAASDPHARITPALSSELKKLRKKNLHEIRVLDLLRNGYPPLKLDSRKWPEVVLHRLATLGDISENLTTFPEAHFHLLHTPFPPLEVGLFESFVAKVSNIAASNARWLLPILAPVQMTSHWLHNALPNVYQRQKDSAIDIMQLSSVLEKNGWKTNFRRARRTIYQEIATPAALEILSQYAETHYVTPDKIANFTNTLQGEHIPTTIIVIEIKAERKNG